MMQTPRVTNISVRKIECKIMDDVGFILWTEFVE